VSTFDKVQDVMKEVLFTVLPVVTNRADNLGDKQRRNIYKVENGNMNRKDANLYGPVISISECSMTRGHQVQHYPTFAFRASLHSCIPPAPS
jgi:hypothetical protein